MMTDDVKRYTKTSLDELMKSYVVAVLKDADNGYQIVCGFPTLDEDSRIVIRLNGQDIVLINSGSCNRLFFADGVESIKCVYNTMSYKQLAIEDIQDDDSPVYVGDVKVFGLRRNSLPIEPGLYLDRYGDTWILTDCLNWQKWDFSDGSYEGYSEMTAIDFLPFTLAKAVVK